MSYSARGRYRAGCSCATEGGSRDSKIQVAIFQLLSFVLRGGRHDVPCPEDGRMAVDMVFDLAPDFRLAIEYDGAYWHHGKEATDARKSDLLVWSGLVHGVMRLCEEPLELIGGGDVSFARGSQPVEVVHLTLLHLLHSRRLVLRPDLYWNIEMFLKSSATRLREEQIACWECSSIALELDVLAEVMQPDGRRPRRPRIWRRRRAEGIVRRPAASV